MHLPLVGIKGLMSGPMTKVVPVLSVSSNKSQKEEHLESEYSHKD